MMRRVVLGALVLVGMASARSWEKCRTLVVGFRTDNPPFGYNRLDTQRPGIEYELISSIAKFHNRTFTVREVTSQREGEDLLERDQIDLLIGSVKSTPELRQRFNASTPYFRTGLGIIVLRSNQNVFTLGDLNGKAVAATPESNADKLIENFIPQAKLEIVRTSADGLGMLQRNEVEGMVHDRSTLQSEVARNPSLRLLDVSLSEDNYVIAINRTRSPQVLENINAALSKLTEARGTDVPAISAIFTKYRLGYAVRTGNTTTVRPGGSGPTPPNPPPGGNTAGGSTVSSTGSGSTGSNNGLEDRVRRLETQVQDLQRALIDLRARIKR
ncbi:MAG TPA: transporter substrate-binding domain-containing protein [Fibrobacteria bacterium]|nr:transporter substrate-binding domain-containing protein [Fibrobacteria bacterium]HOX50818.1 transporter substrate-binding domain-containing protein [Fibrobacteria bacterium]